MRKSDFISGAFPEDAVNDPKAPYNDSRCNVCSFCGERVYEVDVVVIDRTEMAYCEESGEYEEIEAGYEK